MSTLNVSNITDGTTTVGTSYVVNGSAKAWVNFNANAAGNPIGDSLNVSSLLDATTGQFLVNLSSSFANTSYSVTSGQGYLINNFATGYDSVAPYNASAYIFSKYDVTVPTFEDPHYAQTHCMGDLA